MREDNQIQERFADFGAAPSDGVWAGIESQLDKKRRKPVFWWWLVGSVATACFAAFGLTTLFSKTFEKTTSAAKNIQSGLFVAKASSSDKKSKSETKESENSDVYISTSAYSLNKQFSQPKNNFKALTNQPKHLSKKSQLLDESPPIEQEQSHNHEDISILDIAVESIVEPETKVNEELPVDSISKPIIERNPSNPVLPDVSNKIIRPNKLASKWRFGIQYGAWFGRKSLTINKSEWDFSLPPDTNNTVALEESSSQFASRRDYIPFHISLHAEYIFNKRVSLLFGTSYSRFSRSGITNEQVLANQSKTEKIFRAHTLDIPFQINYNFISRKKFQMYAGIGAINSVYLPTKSYISSFDYLGRVSGSIGTRILLTDQLSLNLEPSIQYGWFDTRINYNQSHLMLGGSVGLFFTPKKK